VRTKQVNFAIQHGGGKLVEKGACLAEYLKIFVVFQGGSALIKQIIDPFRRWMTVCRDSSGSHVKCEMISRRTYLGDSVELSFS
jgi:hypothetical protein